MRLLLIAQHFYPEMVSTGLHMTELTTRWKATHPDRDFTIFTAQDAKTDQTAPPFEIHEGLRIHRVSNLGRQHGSLPQRILFSVGFMVRAFGFVFPRRKDFDLILITTNPPFLGFLMLLMQPFSRLPFMLIAYDIYPQIVIRMGVLREGGLVARLWQKVNIAVYNRAERVIAIGEDMKRIILDDMRMRRPERVELIYNWSDRHTVRPIPPQENAFVREHGLEGRTVLLYSGTIGSTHNIEAILQAAQDLENRPDLLFLFIGDGAKASLVERHIAARSAAARHPSSESGSMRPSNVMRLPFQPIDRISETLSCATLSFVCLDPLYTGLSVPSKSYGILAAGVPIVGIMEPDSEIGRAIRRHDCGVVWNGGVAYGGPIDADKKDGDAHDGDARDGDARDGRDLRGGGDASGVRLADLLVQVLADSERLDAMRRHAREAFLTHYDLDISVSNYNRVVSGIGS